MGAGLKQLRDSRYICLVWGDGAERSGWPVDRATNSKCWRMRRRGPMSLGVVVPGCRPHTLRNNNNKQKL